MKIERKQLLNDLQDFVSQGDGVIIGSPGVGKSHVLKELRQYLKSEGVPHLLLRIDQLGDGTAETLQEELAYKGDLIEKLKSIPISGKNAILLFDAFDAARDEGARNRFLGLIRRAIKELVKWNVVVTVRTYDAKKSQELLELFGNSDDSKYRTEGISCRHFTIPPFNEDEILEAFRQIDCPKSIYNEGSQDFKNILANPFNLWLLEKILKSSNDVPDFSQIHSEVQLLDLFWQRRIKDENSEHILHRISSQMVEERSLTVRVSDIHDEVDLNNPVRKTVWDRLQSNEILVKVSSTGQRIAFSHNILFDYAISVLLIEDEPQHLAKFITEDPSRPLFLRPSLTYFFTRLWYYNNSESFWKAFWHIFPSNQSVHLRLVASLIPPSVIANEARDIKQLKPLLQKLQNRETVAEEAITRLLQALQTLQIKCEVPWIDFFDRASQHLHTNFAWNLANLTSDILEKTTDSGVINTCGRVGRRLLEWVWQERETNEDDWYNRFGGFWAVPLIAKTYHTGVEESHCLLSKVLKLMNDNDFPISFLSRLSEHVDKIWDHDPEFVISIYRTVFSHQFISEGETIRGGPVFAFKTFRSQDFGICQYRLVNHFPKFLQALPLHATQAVIQGLNYFILKEHIIRYQRTSVESKNLIETFNFRGETTYFMKDDSYRWDVQIRSDEPIELGDKLFEFIEELAVSKESISLLDSSLDIFRDQVWVAFFWKRLLKTASRFPKVFASRLFDLCIAKPILLHLETSYELGLFLENAASEFTSEQLRQIEESILALPIEAKDEENDEYLEMHRDILLAQIPMELLSTKKAKSIREKMDRENNVPENHPSVSIGPVTWAPYTEEDHFQEQGVDTTTPDNQNLQRFSDPLDKFSSNWRNSKPNMESTELILPRLQEAYSTIKSDTKADREIVDSLWNKLTECAAIIGRVADKLDNVTFVFCRKVLIEAANHEEPIPDPKNDENFDFPGYSSQPRHYAVEGLLRITLYKSDTEILDAIEKLADDPVPSVRMLAAMYLSKVHVKEPERFWNMVENRAIVENNTIVQECLYSALTYVIRPTKENDEKTARIMAKILAKTPLPQQKMGTVDPFSFLIIRLAIVRQNQWALNTINGRFLQDPIRYANLLTRFVKQAIKGYIDPKHTEKNDGEIYLDRTITLLSSIITVTTSAINELGAKLKEQRTEKVEEELRNTYAIIDEVITRLYFSVAYKKDSKPEMNVANIDNVALSIIFNGVNSLMQQIIDFALDRENGLMFAPTAHYFIKLLTSFLICNPKEVLHLASGVVKSSERFGYTPDSIAVMDIVELVEIVLADHRHIVRDDEKCMEDLLNLLDLFAKTGWTDALNLVWRLDEVFR